MTVDRRGEGERAAMKAPGEDWRARAAAIPHAEVLGGTYRNPELLNNARAAWGLLASAFGTVAYRVEQGRPLADIIPAMQHCLLAISAIGKLTERMHPDEDGPVVGARPDEAHTDNLLGRLMCAALEFERGHVFSQSEERHAEHAAQLREAVALLQASKRASHFTTDTETP